MSANNQYAYTPDEIRSKSERFIADVAMCPGFVNATSLFMASAIGIPPFGGAYIAALSTIQASPPSGLALTDEAITEAKAWWEGKEKLIMENERADLSRLGTMYPLYTGFVALAERYEHASVDERSGILGVYLGMLKVDDDVECDGIGAHTYYHDILSVRDALLGDIVMIDVHQFASRNTSELKGLLHLQVKMELSDMTEESGLGTHREQKLRTLNHLLSGERKVGVPSMVRRAEGRVVVSERYEDASGILRAVTGSNWNVDFVSNSEDNAHDHDEHEVFLTREVGPKGSCATPGDDIVTFRAVLSAIEAGNTVTESDMCRLPLLSLFPMLEMAHAVDEQAFCFLWLLATMGQAPRSLEDLEAGKGPRPDSSKDLWLDLNSGLLSFETRRRTKKAELDHNNAKDGLFSITLAIPGWINNTIAERLSNKPFSGMKAVINRVAREYKKMHRRKFGTLDQVANSYLLHLAPCFDRPSDAALITGRIPPQFLAQVHYYNVDIETLNRNWYLAQEHFIKGLLSCGVPSRGSFVKHLSSLTQHGALPQGMSGSKRVVPLEKIAELTAAIAHAFESVRITNALTDSSALLEGHARRLNLQAANLSLMQDIAHASRRNHDVTKISPADEMYGAWIHDKNSSRAIERRATAYPAILREQLEAHRVELAMLQDDAAKLGCEVSVDREVWLRNIPLRVRFYRNKRGEAKIKMTAMSFMDMCEILSAEGIAWPYDRNGIRHTNASLVLCAESAPVRDAMIGHTRSGFDIHAPSSTASVRYVMRSQAAAEKVFKACNFTCLRTGGIWNERQA